MIAHHDSHAHRLVNHLWAEMALFAAGGNDPNYPDI